MTDLSLEQASAGVPPLGAMLATLAEGNPDLQAVLRIMEARAAQAEAEAAVAEERDEELLTEQAAELVDRARRREQSRAHVIALLEALHELQARNESLAAALGACPDCWGHQLGCAHCGGRGAPGHLPVDPQLFSIWVAPVLRAVRRTRTVRPGTDRTRPTAPPPAVPTGVNDHE